MALAIGDLPGLLLGILPSMQSAGGLSLCAPKRCPPELQPDYRTRVGRGYEGAWSGQEGDQTTATGVSGVSGVLHCCPYRADSPLGGECQSRRR